MKHIGMRNIKTSISIILCVLLFKILGRESPFYACLAALVTIQSSISKSYTAGNNRLIGTALGSIVGLIFSYIAKPSFYLHAILIGLGISLLIYLLDILNKNASINISCIVFIAIMINTKGAPSYLYAINRLIDTYIGIAVSLLINKYLNFKAWGDLHE